MRGERSSHTGEIAPDLARLHERLLDAAGEAIIATDAEGDVLYVNDTAALLYGWSRAEMLGQPIIDLTVAAEDVERATSVFSKMRRGDRWAGEFPLRRRDGTPFPAHLVITPVLDDAGELSGIIGISSDITERKEAEQRLLASERLFRTLAENSPDLILRFDREHRHVYANPSVAALTGVPLGAFIGLRIPDLHPPDIAAALEILGTAVEQVFTSRVRLTAETAYPAPDGPLCLQYEVIPETGPDGSVETVLAVARDITGLRAAERRSREVLGRIERAREEERTRIGEDIHDDSIQVMVAVGMRLEAVAHGITDPETLAGLARLSDAVRTSIGRLRTLMFSLLPPELEAGGLASALRTYLETTATGDPPAWRLDDDLTAHPSANTQIILYRIAQEAVTNVRKHARAACVEIRLDHHADGIRMQVRDDGAGFRLDTLGDLGPHHIGTTVMRDRAAAAGGRLEIMSAPGHGTDVTAWLPSEDAAEGVGRS